MKKILLFTIVTISIIGYSCYNDSEDGLFPTYAITACDTANHTFSGAIKPMINNNCITCHQNQKPLLNTHEQISANADNIIKSISHVSGVPAMPQNTAMLDACLITQFEKWVKEGKLNN